MVSANSGTRDAVVALADGQDISPFAGTLPVQRWPSPTTGPDPPSPARKTSVVCHGSCGSPTQRRLAGVSLLQLNEGLLPVFNASDVPEQ